MLVRDVLGLVFIYFIARSLLAKYASLNFQHRFSTERRHHAKSNDVLSLALFKELSGTWLTLFVWTYKKQRTNVMSCMI